MEPPGKFVRSLSSLRKQALAEAKGRLDELDAVIARLRELIDEGRPEPELRRRVRELLRIGIELDAEIDAHHSPASRQAEDVRRAVPPENEGR